MEYNTLKTKEANLSCKTTLQVSALVSLSTPLVKLPVVQDAAWLLMNGLHKQLTLQSNPAGKGSTHFQEG